MATQSAMVMETILNLRRARDKEMDLLDSDCEPSRPTNRGNKLKRKAEYFHEGELGGHKPYKKQIEHAGHTRYILHRNPRRFDEEGYLLLTDDEDEEADREAAEKNPYNDIQIEKLLMPLTSAADLADHPTLSIPYKSQTLSKMVDEALNMVHKERRVLVDMKLLLTRLRGDRGWIPCGDMCSPNDYALFGTELGADGIFSAPQVLSHNSLPSRPRLETADHGGGLAGESLPKLMLEGGQAQFSNEIKKEKGIHDNDDVLDMQVDGVAESELDGAVPHTASSNPREELDNRMDEAPSNEASSTKRDASKDVHGAATGDAEPKDKMTEPSTAGDVPTISTDTVEDPSTSSGHAHQANSNPPTPSAISSAGASPPRMLTRRRAARAPSTPPHTSRAQSPNSATSSTATTTTTTQPAPLHPLYLPPASALPSRDLGLPANEADDTRRVLHAWVQKQEEIVRGAERLYEGHLKALRMRNTVWRWCRAEKYVGTMSDGEDWYDEEEWGIEGIGLRKGMEEGAGEDTAEGGKKTRGRRVAGG